MATDAAPAGEWDAATSVQLNRQAYMMCFLSIKRIYTPVVVCSGRGGRVLECFAFINAKC